LELSRTHIVVALNNDGLLVTAETLAEGSLVDVLVVQVEAVLKPVDVLDNFLIQGLDLAKCNSG
jgi:hypothetical protein